MEPDDKPKINFVAVVVVLTLIIFLTPILLMEHEQKERERQSEAWRSNYTSSEIKVTPEPEIDPTTLAIPCVGMKESDINKTRHPKVFRETTSSYFKGMVVVHYSDANAAQNIPCTVSLTCTDGIVTEVNDYRANPKEIIHYTPKSGGSGGANTGSDLYGDAEEFYYDHMDEFEDLDEAEEYYNDHYK